MTAPRPVAVHTDHIALSVCIIAKDAANQIGDCIDSVDFADEVLVVDSGSADATRAIAEMRGCRVIEKAWLGFGKQKQFAVAAARNDWVLCLDVDERVTPELEGCFIASMQVGVTIRSTKR
jgi:glycosyltransferase involved in cell wall biosynthesis